MLPLKEIFLLICYKTKGNIRNKENQHNLEKYIACTFHAGLYNKLFKVKSRVQQLKTYIFIVFFSNLNIFFHILF